MNICNLHPTNLLQYIAQLKENIPHSGAVSDIQNIKKENNKMVDKLQAYLIEMQNEANIVATTDNSAEIEAKVAEFKATLEAEAIAAKQAKLAKIHSDIDCLQRLIDRETVQAAEVTEPVIGG